MNTGDVKNRNRKKWALNEGIQTIACHHLHSLEDPEWLCPTFRALQWGIDKIDSPLIE